MDRDVINERKDLKMRSHFDEQLAELNRELIAMGALCEEAIAIATKALITGDTCLAANV